MTYGIRTRNVAALAVLALVLGMVGGVILDRAVMSFPFRHHRHDGMRARMLDRMQKDLSLSPAQQTRVDTIMGANEGRIMAMRSRMEAAFDSTRTSFEDSLETVLTPAQMAKFRQGMHRPRRWLFFPFGDDHHHGHGYGRGHDHDGPDGDHDGGDPPPPPGHP